VEIRDTRQKIIPTETMQSLQKELQPLLEAMPKDIQNVSEKVRREKLNELQRQLNRILQHYGNNGDTERVRRTVNDLLSTHHRHSLLPILTQYIKGFESSEFTTKQILSLNEMFEQQIIQQEMKGKENDVLAEETPAAVGDVSMNSDEVRPSMPNPIQNVRLFPDEDRPYTPLYIQVQFPNANSIDPIFDEPVQSSVVSNMSIGNVPDITPDKKKNTAGLGQNKAQRIAARQERMKKRKEEEERKKQTQNK
jgi:hypothetical protein